MVCLYFIFYNYCIYSFGLDHKIYIKIPYSNYKRVFKTNIFKINSPFPPYLLASLEIKTSLLYVSHTQPYSVGYDVYGNVFTTLCT